jgi:hypothetical protein
VLPRNFTILNVEQEKRMRLPTLRQGVLFYSARVTAGLLSERRTCVGSGHGIDGISDGVQHLDSKTLRACPAGVARRGSRRPSVPLGSTSSCPESPYVSALAWVLDRRPVVCISADLALAAPRYKMCADWTCYDSCVLPSPQQRGRGARRRDNVHQLDVILRSFDAPDEVRNMEHGRFEVVRFRGQTYGRATYEPGWQWSKHVGPARGARWCVVEHVGFVVGGAAVAAFEDGSTIDLLTGQLFYIPPVPHDSWVVGSAPYVSLHLFGADGYAT